MDRTPSTPLSRAAAFANRLGIQVPILLAPMAGACPASLSIAVANAGGMGACGALLMNSDSIRSWADGFRNASNGQFQMNLWIRDPTPVRDLELERRQREFLGAWGPPVTSEMGDAVLPDFDEQLNTILDIRPKAISSIMGLYSPSAVSEIKARNILWFATATTVAEARAAEAAGADVIVAQGMEAGGHRGSFQADQAENNMVGLMALLPQVVDAVSIPVVATGGISDPRGVAAALILGASAVQIGTGFLRCPEAKTHPAYADQLARTEAHDTTVTRAFSGRPGRGVANRFVHAAAAPGSPPSAPYPVQRGFTRPMREEAVKTGDTDRMQMWAGQSAKLAQNKPAGEIVHTLWQATQNLLSTAWVEKERLA